MADNATGKKKKIKPWKIIVGIVVLIVIVNGIAGAVGGAKDLLTPVDTAEAVEGEITSTLDTSGVIASEVTRVYASPVNAQVGDVPVTVGQNVKQGDFLLTYDTTSLEKSYDIAELQAKAESATSNDALTKSNESAADFASSNSDINTLQSQIDSLKGEIERLQSKATDNEVKSNNNVDTNEKIGKLQVELETMMTQIAELESKQAVQELSEKETKKLNDLKKDKKAKEKEINKKENSLNDTGDIANNLTNIQAELTKKNNELADLQSKLAEAQSKNAAAEAGVLSDSAKANINYNQQASKLTLEQTAEDLSKAKAGITADFDGIITGIEAAAGTMAAEGTPLITLASAKDVCIEIPVSKYNLANIKIGQKATVDFQETEYAGTVNYISKVATTNESGAAMVTVKVHIDAPDENLILGLDAKVSIDLGNVENVVKVPISAVNSDTTGDFVYVVEDGIVVKKSVTTGMASKEEMEITDGLEAGEKVITTVDSSIIEGIPVTENEPSADAEEVAETEASTEPEGAVETEQFAETEESQETELSVETEEPQETELSTDTTVEE